MISIALFNVFGVRHTSHPPLPAPASTQARARARAQDCIVAVTRPPVRLASVCRSHGGDASDHLCLFISKKYEIHMF